MKELHMVTWLLIIVGAVNWLLVGAFNMDLVATLFGAGTMLTRIVYILVGISGIYELLILLGVIKAQ